VSADAETIRVGGRQLAALSIPNPKDLPWHELGIDVVVESTGRFTKREQAQAHLDAGAGSVVVSAVANDADVMVVLGVNDDAYDPERHRIVSNASCTTNCVTPLAKVLHDAFAIERGNMGANAVVGGGLPATVGAALAFKLRGQARVAVAFFGDGATNTGAFHESLNLAQLWQVPVVFVCENNRWSESTPRSQHLPIKDLTQRAAAFGMRALHVDGQDIEAVHLAALDALAHARAGRGPVLLVCETERLTGHYIGDPQVYRDKDELRKLQETRDPIENLRAQLDVREEEWAALGAEAQSVVEAALEFALAGTDPEPSDALKYVYAEGR
jgi:hypothetical protein